MAPPPQGDALQTEENKEGRGGLGGTETGNQAMVTIVLLSNIQYVQIWLELPKCEPSKQTNENGTELSKN
eukprot:1242246-Amphidinium_carterae.1